MITKDFNFLNVFFAENDLCCETDFDVSVLWDDKDDTVSRSGRNIEIHSPKSITKTIFNIASQVVEDKIKNPHKKDLFSLILHQTVHDYVYKDGDECDDRPSVLISGSKIIVPTLVIREIIEPLIDQTIDIIPLLFVRCPVTDSCRIVHSYMEIEYLDTISSAAIPHTHYPFILVNEAINNKASLFANILIRQLEHNLGNEKADNLLKKLLLNEENELLCYIVKIVSLIEPDPWFVDDFLLYLRSYVNLEKEEVEVFITQLVAAYNQNESMTKFAQLYNQQIQQQWSTFLGLIEKQLEEYRGSKRQTTELMKGIDFARKKLKQRKRREKDTKELNYEDLMDVYRELYGTELAEPGKLYETLLQKNRIW